MVENIAHSHHHHTPNLPNLLNDWIICKTCIAESIEAEDEITSLFLGKILSPYESEGRNISYVVLQLQRNQSVPDLDRELDAYIGDHPWWIVDLQPYKWFPWRNEIILYMSPPNIRRHFQAIAKHQFQDHISCSQLPLHVSNLDGEQWGNRIINVHLQWKNYMQTIFYVFSASNNGDGDHISFAEHSLCPDKINKWECLFIPLSNCTLPKTLTQCRERGCLPAPWGAQFYTNASIDGVIVAESDEDAFIANFSVKLTKNEILNSNDCIPVVAMRSMNPQVVTPESTEVRTACVSNEMQVVFTYGFHLRFNAEFRSRIAHKMFEFRSSHHPIFNPVRACVAAHIRMGDRNIKNVDIMEWCKNCTVIKEDIGKDFDLDCEKQRNIGESTWFVVLFCIVLN